jgi:hypothetical protein
MKIFRLLSLFVVAVSSAVSAQINNVNWTGWDTCKVTSFKTTSFFTSKAFNFTNAENKLLVFVYDDTMNAARASDSMNCEIGYQLGAIIPNLEGSLDTTWTSTIVLDTVNSVTASAASKKYNPALYGGTAGWALGSDDYSVRGHGQIDTTVGTSSSAVIEPIQPFWAPLCRFYLKGLTDNAGTVVKGKFIFLQRAYVNVRNR